MRTSFEDTGRLRRLYKLLAQDRGGGSTTVRLDGGNGNWTSDEALGGIGYLDRRGIDIADALDAHNALWLIPDGGQTLVLTYSTGGAATVHPLDFPIHRTHDLVRELRNRYPEDRTIVAMEPIPGAGAAVRRAVNGVRQTVQIQADGTTRILTGLVGLGYYRDLQRRRLARSHGDGAGVMVAEPDEGGLQVSAGGSGIRITNDQMKSLEDDPLGPDGDGIDGLLDGLSPNVPLILYRDVEEREVSPKPVAESRPGAAVMLAAILHCSDGMHNRRGLCSWTTTCTGRYTISTDWRRSGIVRTSYF